MLTSHSHCFFPSDKNLTRN